MIQPQDLNTDSNEMLAATTTRLAQRMATAAATNTPTVAIANNNKAKLVRQAASTTRNQQQQQQQQQRKISWSASSASRDSAAVSLCNSTCSSAELQAPANSEAKWESCQPGKLARQQRQLEQLKLELAAAASDSALSPPASAAPPAAAAAPSQSPDSLIEDTLTTLSSASSSSSGTTKSEANNQVASAAIADCGFEQAPRACEANTRPTTKTKRKPERKRRTTGKRASSDQEEEEVEGVEEDLRMDLSFSGAGFMGCYYFGVVDCWNKYIPRERVRRVAGASAGSLIAAYYLMDLPLDTCLGMIIEMTEDIRRRPLGVFDRSNQMVDVLPRYLDRMFPEDAHKRVNGRLFVCMTRLKDMKCVVVNEFETRQDLIDALNCSCFIPVWSGNHVSTYRGVKHIDGGFTNNLPVFDEHTVRICCFSGASDIAPSDGARMELLTSSFQGMPFNVNWANMKRVTKALWPPTPAYIISLLEQGFKDTKDFILDNDLIQCDRCFGATQPERQPIWTKRSPTISPAPSPFVSRAPSHLDLSLGGGGGDLHARAVSPPAAKTDQRLGTASSEANQKKHGRSSFREQLSAKLRRIAGPTTTTTTTKADQEAAEHQSVVVPPTIVIDATEADHPDHPDPGHQTGDAERRLVTIGQIMELELANSSGPTSVPADGEAKEAAASCSSSGHSSASPESSETDDQQHDEDPAKQAGRRGAEGPADRAQPVKMGRYTGNRRQSQQLAPSVSPAEKFFASRRNTQAQLDTSRLAGQAKAKLARATDVESNVGGKQQQQQQQQRQQQNHLLPAKFSFAPEPLPSCPPSPNLNRHCTECIRMRQEARADGLDEVIRVEAEKYRDLGDEPAGGSSGAGGGGKQASSSTSSGSLKSKLKSPIRWMKQRLGVGQQSMSSYDFVMDQVDLGEFRPTPAPGLLESVAF